MQLRIESPQRRDVADREQCGVSLREIGDFFGGLNYAAVAQRLRRLTSADKQEAARLLSKCQKI